MTQERRTAPRRWADVSVPVVTTAILGVFFLLRSRHGLHFPTPWPDEGSFLWQAINLAEFGTLFSPELNPERHILWMPPGYMATMAAVFAVFGFSLEVARLVSGLLLALTTVLAVMLLQRARARVAHVVVFGVYLVGPIFQLASNTARMEPLVLCVATGAALLVTRGRTAAGLGLAAFAPLIHPNGLFPAVAVLLLLAHRHRVARVPVRIAPWEWGVVASLVVSYGAYAAYVLAHLSEFFLDIGTQLAWKQAESAMNGGVAERATRVESLVLLFAWLVGALGYWWARRTAPGASEHVEGADDSMPAVVALSGTFVVQSMLTVGWLYDLYAAYACALVTVLVAEVAVRTALRLRAPARHAAVVATFAVAVVASSWVVRQPYLMRSLARATVIRAEGPPYHTSEDRRAVLGYLGMLSKSGSYTVQFSPAADSLLYAELRYYGIRPLQQTRYDGVADVYVFHESVWIPEELQTLAALRMGFQQGIVAPVEKWPVIHERDGTESWRVYRRR